MIALLMGSSTACHMSSSLTALRFIYKQLTEKHKVPEIVQEIEIQLSDTSLKADLYMPPTQKVKGSVLLVHGMSLRGHRDPRVINSARSIAGCGFQVIAPNYPEIARLEITGDTIVNIRESLEYMCSQPQLNTHGKVSVFTPSFSAGMALIAVAHPGVAQNISTICCIGPPGTINGTLEFCLGQRDIDEYAAMIIMKNFAAHALGNKKKVIRAFELAAHDVSWQPAAIQLPDHLKTMSSSELEMFHKCHKSPEYRLSLLPGMLKGITDLQEQMDILKHIQGIKAPVTLIHGRDDKVISAQESINIHERLQELAIESRLEITPLISHGDSRLHLADIPKIFHLLGAFRHFFKNAAYQN